MMRLQNHPNRMRRFAQFSFGMALLLIIFPALFTEPPPKILPDTTSLDGWAHVTPHIVGQGDQRANRPHCFPWGTSHSDPPDNQLCAFTKAACDYWQKYFSPKFEDTGACTLNHATMFCLKVKKVKEQRESFLCTLSARRCEYLIEAIKSSKEMKSSGICARPPDMGT